MGRDVYYCITVQSDFEHFKEQGNFFLISNKNLLSVQNSFPSPVSTDFGKQKCHSIFLIRLKYWEAAEKDLVNSRLSREPGQLSLVYPGVHQTQLTKTYYYYYYLNVAVLLWPDCMQFWAPQCWEGCEGASRKGQKSYRRAGKNVPWGAANFGLIT